jgi:hypothetical protein
MSNKDYVSPFGTNATIARLVSDKKADPAQKKCDIRSNFKPISQIDVESMLNITTITKPREDIRMYVLVNSQLPTLHAGIQAGHALAEVVHYHQGLPILKEWVENHKTLILLSATLEQMSEMKDYFKSKDRKFSSFSEPDLDNLETAVAFEPMNAQEGKVLFGKFKLYK